MPYGLTQHLPFPEAPDQFKRGMELWDSMKTEELRQNRESADLAAGGLAANGDLTGAAQEYYRRGFQQPGSAYAGQQRVQNLDAIAAQQRAQENEDRAKRAPLQDAERTQSLEGIQRSRAVAAATPGINETAVTDPPAAYEQALKLGGPVAAEPYAGIAKAHVQKLYDFSSHLYDTLSRAETPEQWNATLDSAARVPGVKPEMLAEHRIANPEAFATEKARHLQDLDVERGFLAPHVNSMTAGKTPALIASAQALIADRRRLGQTEPSLEEATDIVKRQGSRAEAAPDTAAARDRRLNIMDRNTNVRAASYDPDVVMAKSFASGVGKNMAVQAAREGQAKIVDGHLELGAQLAGGWELDPKKLTPEQKMQRANFNAATGAINGQDLYRIITGAAKPDSSTPVVALQLRSVNEMLNSEAARLATMGQGQVALATREELRGVMGDFTKAPSAETYLKVLKFTKRIMGEFKNVPVTGIEKVNDLAKTIRARQNSIDRFGHAVGAPAREPMGQETPPETGETQSLGAGTFHYDMNGELVGGQ